MGIAPKKNNKKGEKLLLKMGFSMIFVDFWSFFESFIWGKINCKHSNISVSVDGVQQICSKVPW